MKTGRSLTELAAEIERQAVSKKDYLADTRKMSIAMEPVVAYGKDEAPHLILEGHEQKYGITDIAHRQIGTALGIPAKYYDKMLAEYPELLLKNINGWFGHEPAERMIRTLDGNMRAFLSNRYRRIDNMEVAQAVLPIIGEMEEARVESCEITESRMYIKVVNPRLETEVVPGDVVQAGIIISNSEVGQGSVNIQPLVFRLVCTNGMVVNDASTRKNHVGRAGAAGENFELYSDCLLYTSKSWDYLNDPLDEPEEWLINLQNHLLWGSYQTGRDDDEDVVVLEAIVSMAHKLGLGPYDLAGPVRRILDELTLV